MLFMSLEIIIPEKHQRLVLLMTFFLICWLHFFTLFSIVAFHNLNEQIKIKTWVTHKEKREYVIKVHGGNIVDFVNLHKYMVITTSKSLVQIAKNRVFLSNTVPVQSSGYPLIEPTRLSGHLKGCTRSAPSREN